MSPRTNFSSDLRFAADFRITVDAIRDELVYLAPPPVTAPSRNYGATGYISAEDQEHWLYGHASCFLSGVTGEANPPRGNLLAFAASGLLGSYPGYPWSSAS